MRPAGTVEQADVALTAPTRPPLVRRRARDPHLIGDVRDRPTALNPGDELLATVDRQPSVSAMHRRASSESACCLAVAHLLPEARLHADPVNNVGGRYT